MNEEEYINNELNPASGKDQSEIIRLLSYYWFKSFGNKKMLHVYKKLLLAVLALLVTLFIFFFFLFIVPGLQEFGNSRKHITTGIPELKKDVAYKKQITQLDKDLQRLSRKFNAFAPGLSYIVINTTDNRFFLYTNNKLVREGFCSSGSYTLLQTAEGSKQWIFKTPKGKFWIQQKITSPLWKRPDWSFVEEGLPIPPPNDESRFEYGVLGDYAMSLGDGYLIHGTIYKRFLGMPVTHGCIRLNDDDLKTIFNTLNIGSKVYIF
jgi:hypothetical protein